MAGLTLASNVVATGITAEIAATNTRLTRTSGRLATGLRINAPEDDPSGFVIAAGLQTRSQGYDAALQSMQNTHNAVDVASGAITAIIAITQRIRALAVKAATSIYSTQQVADMQAEVVQLIHEVNSISEETKFNGIPLLSGSPESLIPQVVQTAAGFFDSAGPYGVSTSVSVTLGSRPQAGNLLIAGISHGDGWGGGGGPAIIDAPPGWKLVDAVDNANHNGLAIYSRVADGTESGSYSWTVTNTLPGNQLGAAIAEIANANTVSPLATEVTQRSGLIDATHPLETASITATIDGLLPLAFFNSHSAAAITSTTTDWTTEQLPRTFYNSIALQTHAPTVAGEVLQAGVDTGYGPTEGNSSIILLNPKHVVNPRVLETQVGAGQWETAEASIAPLSAQALTLANIDLQQSPQAALATCDGALESLTTQQGQLGAYGLSLRDFTNTANVASVADTAAFSAIRDANVASEVSAFTRDTLLRSFGTALLAQTNISARDVLQLFRPAGEALALI